ncbi:HEAT repeat domain-containing protein [Haliangium sp.]|uniref:HEAT repeat domain-containing protein n=1 Tax=Haliangium sp. TaxID=2663208 RepID=UPI003D10B1AC
MLCSGCTCDPPAQAPPPPVPADAAPAPEQIILDSIAVKSIDPAQPVELYPRQLAQQLGAALVDSGLFASRPEDVAPGYRGRHATLELLIEYDPAGLGSRGTSALVVVIDAAIAWQDPAALDPAPWDHLLAEQPWSPADEPGAAPSPPEPGAVATLVADAVAQIGARLVAREQVRIGGDAAVTDLLSDRAADADMHAWALALVAHRRSRPLLDAVVPHLDAGRPGVQLAAIRALAAIGDARAVAPLTRAVRFEDSEPLAAVIDAVATLGGDEAASFLEFVASGHPDPALRARAAEARAGLPAAAAQ